MSDPPLDPRSPADRGVSTPLGYTLTLAISTLLVTGLIVAGSNFVSSQREVVIENELEVVGEQVAGQLEQVDRLVTASDDVGAVRINRSIPQKAAGETYNVLLEPGSPPALRLETANSDASVTVAVPLQNAVGDTSASGGVVVARWCTACTPSRLVIESG